MLTRGMMCASVKEVDVDKTKLGRFSWTKVGGAGKMTYIMTVYMPHNREKDDKAFIARCLRRNNQRAAPHCAPQSKQRSQLEAAQDLVPLCDDAERSARNLQRDT